MQAPIHGQAARAECRAADPALSVLVPVFNEAATIAEVVERIRCAHPVGKLEIVVVDDGSTDRTQEILESFAERGEIRLARHRSNLGKGAAICSAIYEATGDYLIVHDGDLEYDPEDHKLLLRPLMDETADVVFGTRRGGGRWPRTMRFSQRLANSMITSLVNHLGSLQLTDVEACCKAFRRSVCRRLPLREPGFGFDPEFALRVSRAGFRVAEVPVHYVPRSRAEGKKLSWRDGLDVVRSVLQYGLIEKL